MNFLKNKKIETMIHYPVPPHKQKAYKEFSNLSLPISELIHETTLSIPMDPTLEINQVNYIIETLNKF